VAIDQNHVQWLAKYYPGDASCPNLEDVDTAMKLCAHCRLRDDEMRIIHLTPMKDGRMFWWQPMCECWSREKGKAYGPGPECPFRLEAVFARRRFVFPCLEDMRHFFYLVGEGFICVEAETFATTVTFRFKPEATADGHKQLSKFRRVVERTALKKREEMLADPVQPKAQHLKKRIGAGRDENGKPIVRKRFIGSPET